MQPRVDPGERGGAGSVVEVLVGAPDGEVGVGARQVDRDRAWSMEQSPEIAWNRALARELLEQKQEAIAAWNEYLKLDSDSAWAREARGRIADLRAF